MLKGINQWCFPQDTPLEEIFYVSKRAGFDVVELNLNERGAVGLTLNQESRELKEILAKAEEEQIQLKSLSTDLLWKFPLTSSNLEIREKGKKIVKDMLRIARIMGMDTILVVPGIVTKKVSYLECYERSQEMISRLIPVAEEYGVKIGIENVWNKFLLSPLEMVRFIDAFNSDYIGAYFDVGNILQYGYPEQWISILNERIFKVHVKDFNHHIGNIHGFTNLLSGDVDWQAVIRQLRSIHYEDSLVAELSPYSLDKYSLIEDTSRHLDVILNL